MTDWVPFVITWDKAGDAMKAYYNGSQSGSTQTIAGTWAGALNSASCVIGAANTTPATPWYGYLAHGAVWDRALPAAEIADLAVV